MGARFWTSRLRQIRRAEQGSVLPVVGIAFIVLVGAVGTSVDMGRAQVVQSKLQTSLDSAGLAAGSLVNATSIMPTVNKYFYVNFPVSFMNSTVKNLSATPNANNTKIELSVQADVPTTFMKIFNINKVTVGASTEVTRAAKGMELVLVMDNTGSMANPAGGSGTKIQAAKDAATSLLNILYGGNNTVRNLWVGLVPFSQAVNIGTTGHSAWLDSTYDATLRWGTSSWYGCVEARSNGALTPQYDITDDPPSVKKFRQYNSMCNTNTTYESNKWYGTNASHNNCLTTAGLQYLATSPTTIGPNLYCPQPLQSMVAEENTVLTGINNMQPNGDTHIDLGLAWGWRMLSPRWRGIWGGEMDATGNAEFPQLPLDYNTPLMQKVVILMTDGDNTLNGTNAAGTATANPGLYTAYGFPDNNWLNASPNECTSGANCAKGQTVMDNRTTSVCTSMKTNGIIIYTIALGANVSSNGQAILLNCATDSNHYFLSPTTNDLQAIFQQIGNALANLYISH